MGIEPTLVQWLSRQPELADVSVSMDVPQDRPERFVTVERTGGGSTTRGIIGTPTIAVQCWAGTRLEAADLADTVAGVLGRSIELPQVKRLIINSVANFPLDETQPRYQIVADMVTQQS